MERRKLNETDIRKNCIFKTVIGYSAFILLEVLLVITILGLVFSTLTLIFKNIYESSLRISSKSSKLNLRAQIFWDLTRSLYGSKRAVLKNGTELYLITSGGQFYGGVVKAIYLFKNGTLYYYEFPYPYGSLYDYDRKSLIELGYFDRFELLALYNGKEYKNYPRKAGLYKLVIDNDTFYIKTF